MKLTYLCSIDKCDWDLVHLQRRHFLQFLISCITNVVKFYVLELNCFFKPTLLLFLDNYGLGLVHFLASSLCSYAQKIFRTFFSIDVVTSWMFYVSKLDITRVGLFSVRSLLFY